MATDTDRAALLAALKHVQESGGHLMPQWRTDHFQGYTHFPHVDSQEAAEVMNRELEHLASADYLDKVFFDRLTVCPACGSHHVNVREACTTCKSPHISSVSLLHHFRCGYVAPVDAFPKDAEGRVCPKCHGRLTDLGTDHDVPGENFVCHQCHSSFQVPDVEGLCMSCQTRTPGVELVHRDIHSYRINSLGIAALARGRLFDEEDELLREGEALPIYRRHVFMFLAEDEKRRAKRYGTDFSLILLRVESKPAREFERLAITLAGNLRGSDKIGRHDEEHLLILLPATNRAAATLWLERFMTRKHALPHGDIVSARVIELNLDADLSDQIATTARQMWTPGASLASSGTQLWSEAGAS